jgi:hypothetical protein
MMAIGPRADSEEMDVSVPPATDDGSQPIPPLEPTTDVPRRGALGEVVHGRRVVLHF